MYSEKNDRYYVGYSNDVAKRLKEHNSGKTKSTRPGRPWVLKYSEEYQDELAAKRREIEIKKKKSRKYIEFLIRSVK